MNLPDLKSARIRTNQESETIDVTSISSDVLKNKKYFLRTYGCQMNEHDSEEIKAILEGLKMTPTEDLESADVVILNTCAI